MGKKTKNPNRLAKEESAKLEAARLEASKLEAERLKAEALAEQRAELSIEQRAEFENNLKIMIIMTKLLNTFKSQTTHTSDTGDKSIERAITELEKSINNISSSGKNSAIIAALQEVHAIVEGMPECTLQNAKTLIISAITMLEGTVDSDLEAAMAIGQELEETSKLDAKQAADEERELNGDKSIIHLEEENNIAIDTSKELGTEPSVDEEPSYTSNIVNRVDTDLAWQIIEETANEAIFDEDIVVINPETAAAVEKNQETSDIIAEMQATATASLNQGGIMGAISSWWSGGGSGV